MGSHRQSLQLRLGQSKARHCSTDQAGTEITDTTWIRSICQEVESRDVPPYPRWPWSVLHVVPAMTRISRNVIYPARA